MNPDNKAFGMDPAANTFVFVVVGVVLVVPIVVNVDVVVVARKNCC